LVRIVDAPKFISNVPQSGQKTTQHSLLPERPTFLCCLVEFINFTIQMLGKIKSAGAAWVQRLDDIGSVSLTLAGYQHLKVLDGWLFFLYALHFIVDIYIPQAQREDWVRGRINCRQ
jgi:hypothetical protein